MTTKNKHDGNEGATRRDFIHIAAAGASVVGGATVVWPFIDSLNPAADTLALASIEVDLAPLAVGQSMIVKWRGKPVFIRHRTEQEIAESKAVAMDDLVDPENDDDRVQKDQYLILVGVCTHLGCVPGGSKPSQERGDFNGWLCKCHGSHYDTSGRIRKGPAPKNLEVPSYAYVSDTVVKIG